MGKKKVTIITAAGFTVPPAFGGPSTGDITCKLREKEIFKFYDKEREKFHKVELKTSEQITIGEYLYKILCDYYCPKKPSEKQEKSCENCDISVINFETIIHFLEEIYSFQTSLSNSGSDRKKKGLKPALFSLKPKIKYELENLRKKVNVSLSISSIAKRISIAKLIKIIYYNFIEEIITHEKLEKLNSNKENLGMNTFKDEFLSKHLSENNFVRRIYTLNYDTWLNEFHGLFDGFDAKGKFLSQKVIKNFEIDCHYNLHGSIFWENKKITTKKSQVRYDYLKNNPYSDTSMDKELLIATPIITGYNKLKRMKFEPYLQFYFALMNDIINSDKLILIGYSFSDTHINHLISLYKNKCVVVDYIRDWTDDSCKFYDNSVKEKVKSINSSNWNFGYLNKSPKDPKGWVESENGKVKFWWKGLDNNFYNAWEEIIK